MSQRFFNIKKIRNTKYLVFSLFTVVFIVSSSITASIDLPSKLNLLSEAAPRLKSENLIFNNPNTPNDYPTSKVIVNGKDASKSLLNPHIIRHSTGPHSGSGNNSFKGLDFLNISNIEFLSLFDTTTQPSIHTDSFNINIPSNYMNTTGWFNISNITPLYDWRHIENDRIGSYTLISRAGSPPYHTEAAMQFNFTEEYMNFS